MTGYGQRRFHSRPARAAPRWAVLALLATATVLQAEVPNRIESRDPDREVPLWISAEEAVPGGTLRRDLFTDHEWSRLQSHLTAKQERLRQRSGRQGSANELQDRCWMYLGERHVDWYPAKPNDSLDHLVEHALGIYLGDVDDIEEGFYRGEPGSLVSIELDTVLEHPPHLETPTRALVFFPHARIPVDDLWLCKKGRRHPSRPVVGGRMLVFAYRTAPVPGENRVIYADDEELFFTTADGELSVPARFEAELLETPFDLAGLERTIRRRLGAPSPSGPDPNP